MGIQRSDNKSAAPDASHSCPPGVFTAEAGAGRFELFFHIQQQDLVACLRVCVHVHAPMLFAHIFILAFWGKLSQFCAV